MARVEEIVVRDIPAAPGAYLSPEEALAANPERTVRIGKYATEKQAETAARRVNAGEVKKWPNTRYRVMWAWSKDAVVTVETEENGVVKTEEVKGAYETLLTYLENVPETWLKKVSPGKRPRKSDNDTGTSDVEEAFEDIED